MLAFLFSRSRTASYALLALVAAGCRANSPGESDYAPVAGTFTAVEEAPLDKVLKATLDSMRALQLRPMERERDAFKALVVGETVMGGLQQTHEVRVSLSRESETTTKITMRILGRRDGERLKQIHEEIQKRLGTSPAAPPR